MIKILYTISLLLGISFLTNAQDTIILSLNQVLELGAQNSPLLKSAKVNYNKAYWNNQVYLSTKKPQLTLVSDLPGYNNSVQAITQQDGTSEFRSITNLNSSLAMNLSQSIPLTGGQIFVSSGIKRYDNLNTHNYSYGGALFEIGLEQNIFAQNPYKWDKKIEPKKLELSKKQFKQDMEIINYKSLEFFFDLLYDQMSYKISSKNLENNAKLKKIAQEKFRLGKISKDELLKISIMYKNSLSNEINSKVLMENSSLNLKSHLGIKNKKQILLKESSKIPNLTIPIKDALKMALTNNPNSLNYKIRELESLKELDKSKKNNGFQSILKASFGLSGQGKTIDRYTKGVNDLSMFNISLSLPILDWGRRKAKVKTAQESKELTFTNIEQEKNDFRNTVVAAINNYESLKKRYVLEKEATQDAIQRFEIAYKRYLSEDISITELSLANNEMDSSKRSLQYIMKQCWLSYYKIKILTLMD